LWGLQQLRLQTGLPSLRDIARRSRHDAHASSFPLSLGAQHPSEAFRGRRLPSWETTETMVRFSVDVDEWNQRWIEARTNRASG
jgi:hypothetical protein